MLDADYTPSVDYGENPTEETGNLRIYVTETTDGWFVGVTLPDGSSILDGAGPYRSRELALAAGRQHAVTWEHRPCSK